MESSAVVATVRTVASCVLFAFLFTGPPGCSARSDGGGSPHEVAPSAADAPPSLSAPFDVGSVVRRVHFAFRSEGDELTGGHGTYGSRVHAGRVLITPVRASGEGGMPVRGEAFEAETIAAGPIPAAANSALHATELQNDGSIRLDRSGTIEEVRNTEDGVEQSWSVPASSPGTGDWVVRVRVAGPPYAGETASGLHFLDPNTGLGVRYGVASWTAAGGEEHAIRPRYEDGVIVLRIPRPLVQSGARPAWLRVVVGPERGIDAPIIAAASGDQSAPVVAFGGHVFLVVWCDTRNGGGEEIYGTRVSKAGDVLDPAGIPIAIGDGKRHVNDSVAFDGEHFFVVWAQGPVTGPFDVYGARVSTAGRVLDPTGIAISTAYGDQYTPRVAFDGTNYLVVWTDGRGRNWTISGSRVSPMGTVLDPDGFVIAIGPAYLDDSALSFDGTNYLVVWQDYRNGEPDVYASRVSRSGTVLDGAAFPLSAVAGRHTAPSVAFDGTQWFVAWEDARELNTPRQIRGARVSQAGAVLDPSGILISTKSSNGTMFPAVSSDGASVFIVWSDFRSSVFPGGGADTYGARVSRDGVLLDSDIPIATAAFEQFWPAIAFDGDQYLVVWQDYRSFESNDIYGARVTSSGVVRDPSGRLLSTAVPNAEREPAVASDGCGYLVVWTDNRAGGLDVVGARVDRGGHVLDPSGIPIGAAPWEQRAPKVSHGAGEYLVVWEDRRTARSFDVYGARVGDDGSLRDPNDIVIAESASDEGAPSVTFGAGAFFVAWERAHDAQTDVLGARVTVDGRVRDHVGVALSRTGSSHAAPAASFDGVHYVTVWTDRRAESSLDVYAARVAPDGTNMDEPGIPIATGCANASAPAVTSDGSQTFIAWQDDRDGSLDVYAARMTQRGQVLDPEGIPIDTHSGDQTAPAVTFAGGRFLVAWQDDRSGASLDVYGRFVKRSGATSSRPFGIATRASDERAPALASGADGSTLVVYERLVPALDAVRVRARLVRP